MLREILGGGALWVAIYGTFVLNFCDFTRSAKTKKSIVWGNLFGIPVNTLFFGVIVVVLAGGRLAIDGKVIASPTDVVESHRQHAHAHPRLRGPADLDHRGQPDGQLRGSVIRAGRARFRLRPLPQAVLPFSAFSWFIAAGLAAVIYFVVADRRRSYEDVSGEAIAVESNH